MNIFGKKEKAIKLPEKNIGKSNLKNLNQKNLSKKNINNINSKNRKDVRNRIRKNFKQKNNLKNRKELKTITYIIVIAIICMLFLTGYSIGKSISETLIETTAEVAEPILELKTNKELNITATENSGEYPFQVTNYKEDKITEVPIQYTIEILSDTDESIAFELYKNGEKVELQNQKTNILELKANELQEDNYILKISYDKTKSDSIYDIIEKIQIKIHSEQKEI